MSVPTLPVVTMEGTRSQRRHSGWLLLIGVTVATLLAICGWLIYLQVNDNIGGHGLAWGLAFAFVPVVPLTALLLWLDRFDPSPVGWLVLALAWGGLGATFIALQVNSHVAPHIGDIYGPSARSAVFVAPWVEEACKGAIVLVIAFARRHRFNGIVDAVVLAGLSGIGFAFTENIVYYGNVFARATASDRGTDVALDAVRHLFLWRGVALPFAHPMFTMLTGIGVGIAVRQRHTIVRILAPVAGYVCAVVGHMGYNAAASFTTRTDGLWPMYVATVLPLLAILVAFVLWVRVSEQRVIAARLGDYLVYGWLNQMQIDAVSSISARRAARRAARQDGEERREAVRRYQRLSCELGFLRDKIVRGVAGPEALDREGELIAAVRLLLPLTAPASPGRTPRPAGVGW